MHTTLKSTFILCSFVSLCSCGLFGPDTVIEGKVVDNFGNPIVGANVQIENTTFQGTTDRAGQFTVNYAPGTFTIKISLDGYTSRSLDLQITEGTKYPLNDTRLYKTPPGNGVFLAGSDDYIPLLKAVVERIELGSAGFGAEKFRYSLTLEEATDEQIDALIAAVKETNPEKAKEFHIADSSPDNLEPHLISGDQIGMATLGLMGSSGNFTIAKEESSRFEGFLYRSVAIPPEEPFSSKSVCYVPVGKNMFGSTMINDEKSAYCLPGSEQSARKMRRLSQSELSNVLQTLQIVPGEGIGPIRLGELNDKPLEILGKPSKTGEYDYGIFQQYSLSHSFVMVRSHSSTHKIFSVEIVRDLGDSTDEEIRSSVDHLPKLKGSITLGSTMEELEQTLGKPKSVEPISMPGFSCGPGKEGIDDIMLHYEGIDIRYCGSVIGFTIYDK